MASIFKKRVLKEKLDSFEIPDFQSKLEIVTQWHKAYKNGSLKKKTESEVEQEFIQNIFCEVLDYTRYPSEPHTIIPQGKTQTSGQKPDAILGHFKSDKDITKVAAVCEIKDANTPLDKSQRREGSLSPVQQAFKYKTQYKNCDFVIATNFFEIRLLKDNELNYEKWTLEDLVNPANNHYEFKKFYYLLCEKHLIVARGKSKTLQILSDIQVEQEKITKEFYKLYKELRQKLIKNIIKNNPEAKKRENFYHLTVEKAQKIIDRLVFVAFCEDLGLLPENILLKVIQSDNNTFGSTWDTLKGFFNAVDTGSPKLNNAQGYNGELFKPDKDLDALIIDDEICREFLQIGQYDFSEDLSVNILGHIFEQSISDLEELKLLGEGQDFDSKKTKRKKDGIFYTPEYIVDYIVENAIGDWLKERETELMEKHNVKVDLKDDNYNKRLLKAYEEYQNILQNIKVLDPSCGSGAFLVRVFDFLLSENQRVADTIADLKGGAMTIFDTEKNFKNILQNNIFGVDLNPESVEITKLSLWLKTAQKGKKLASLHNNIKCGNSLIPETEIAGDKAFNWSIEFKKVMEEGGFDVIVGNPPYVKEYISKAAFDGLHNNPHYQGKMDLWYLFGVLGLELTKNQTGIVSYIAPSNWITNAGASKFRNYVLKNATLLKFIDFGNFKVFDDAGIQTMIYVMRNMKQKNEYQFEYQTVKDSRIDHEANRLFLAKVKLDNFSYFSASIAPKDLIDKPITFVSQELRPILKKIRQSSNFKLKKEEVAQGIVAPQDVLNETNANKLGEKFYKDQGVFVLNNKELEAIEVDTQEKDLIKPFYESSNLYKYWGNSKNDKWIIYTDSSYKSDSSLSDYTNLKRHLDQFQEIITSHNKPYGLHRARDEKFFKGSKIISLRKCKTPTFTYTSFDCYVSQTYFVIKANEVNMKYLTGLLNSKVVKFWLKHKGKMQGDMLQIDKGPLLQIPLLTPDQKYIESISELVEKIIQNKQKTYDYNQLKDKARIDNQYDREIELTKKIELLEIEAPQLESKIDEIVFDLYDLTPEERKIVLESTSN